ncbi:MAG: hypothetical protein Q4F09_01085 [Erysipelotrichaceae bacterium]|nr:hypothetical protein [Erysipelotrichaceae bacterium]
MRIQKKRAIIALCFLLLALCACRNTGASRGSTEEKVTMDGFREFYYTFSNINYNAEYQRYHFYVKDGKRMFFHDHRQVVEDYGPAEEKDRTRFGEFELTDAEWEKFAAFLIKGTARDRKENTDSGDSGPWLYLYRENYDPQGQEFYFDSYGTLKDFERFCEGLADSGR